MKREGSAAGGGDWAGQGPAQGRILRGTCRLLRIESRVLTGSLSTCVQTKGYDPVFGARPVKRAVQRELETGLAKALLRGEFGEDDTGRPTILTSDLTTLHCCAASCGLLVDT